MKRRSNGEHSVIWNPQRGNFVARATQGLPRPVNASGRTRQEALANLRKRLTAKPHEVVGLPIRPTFAKWWEYAHANISLDGTPEHRRNNDANIRRYCFPTLGHLRLSEINDTHGDQLLRVLREQGPGGARTARPTHYLGLDRLRGAVSGGAQPGARGDVASAAASTALLTSG